MELVAKAVVLTGGVASLGLAGGVASLELVTVTGGVASLELVARATGGVASLGWATGLLSPLTERGGLEKFFTNDSRPREQWA